MAIAEVKEKRLYSFLGTGGWTSTEFEELIKRFNQPSEGAPSTLSVKEVLEQFISSNEPLYKQQGLTSNQMEGIYNIGYQAYNQSNYPHAIAAFRLLFMLNPAEPRYLFSLGLALEKSKQPFEATSAYMMHSFLEENNPVPLFRAAICFLELDQRAAAKFLFIRTIDLCAIDPVTFGVISERAKLFLDGLES